LDDETIQLEIAPGTTVKVTRQAVVRVVEPLSDELGAGPAETPTDAGLTYPDEETR
jgi:hypothetical protein